MTTISLLSGRYAAPARRSHASRAKAALKRSAIRYAELMAYADPTGMAGYAMVADQADVAPVWPAAPGVR
jgi:hypothetical protein